MTSDLQKAIESLIESYDTETYGRKAEMRNKLKTLKIAYEGMEEAMTDTQKRVRFLRECLETGMSKREAARELCKHDPRIGLNSAETIVYLNFSGMYESTKKGRRIYKDELEDRNIAVTCPPPQDITDDEALL